MIRERTLGHDGRVFAFREAGSESNPPVILLHAMGPDASDWDAVAEALADRFHVIALHQRGFGPSQRMPEYSFVLMRDDVLALTEALGFEKFALLGHSMGGSVAYLVAEAVPERVSWLIVEDTPPPWGSEMPDPPAEPPRPVPFDWEAWRGIAAGLKHPDPAWWADRPKIACPTLLFGGGDSSHVPQQLIARVATLIPNARFLTISDAGHLVHGARFEQFMAGVNGFLAEVAGA